MFTDAMMAVYFFTILFIIAGGAIGYGMFKSIGAIFAFNIGFGILAWLILPGLLGLV